MDQNAKNTGLKFCHKKIFFPYSKSWAKILKYVKHKIFMLVFFLQSKRTYWTKMPKIQDWNFIYKWTFYTYFLYTLSILFLHILFVFYFTQNEVKHTFSNVIWCVDSEYRIKKGKTHKGTKIKSKYCSKKSSKKNIFLIFKSMS